MNVNPSTLLFENLTDDEATTLHAQAEEIVMKGNVPLRENVFVRTWVEAGKFDDRQWLLTMSVVYPQRALISVVRHRQSR